MNLFRDNLASLLQECVISNPDKVLYISGDEEIITRDIWDSACRLSAALRALGIQRGSRVLLMLPNIPEYVVAYFAILHAGAVVVPVNVMLREREIHFLMEDCEARAIITGQDTVHDVLAATKHLATLRHIIVQGDDISADTLGFAELIEQHEPDESLTDVSPEDTAVIFYTAGITGSPKGAELTHRSLLGNARAGVQLLQVRSKDRILGVLPFFHAFGKTAVLNTPLAAGASVILMTEFNPAAILKAVQDHRITIFPATPYIYRKLLSCPDRTEYDFSSVRYCISGASALKPDLLEKFEKEFSTTIVEGYGLCETTALATLNQLHRDRRPGSIGTPIEGVDIKLIDNDGEEAPPGEVGEIIIRSDYIMKGYLNRPEATKEVLRDGWFYTGDLARADEDGYLYIIDRKKDMIVKAGFSIYPVEIERLLLSHPSIAEVAVIGVPDQVHGEEIKACIVLREGAELTLAELADYCRERMARYKCPRYVQFYKQLPKNPSGRILKKKLRQISGLEERN